mgnify:CR=1 FL=1
MLATALKEWAMESMGMEIPSILRSFRPMVLKLTGLSPDIRLHFALYDHIFYEISENVLRAWVGSTILNIYTKHSTSKNIKNEAQNVSRKLLRKETYLKVLKL